MALGTSFTRRLCPTRHHNLGRDFTCERRHSESGRPCPPGAITPKTCARSWSAVRSFGRVLSCLVARSCRFYAIWQERSWWHCEIKSHRSFSRGFCLCLSTIGQRIGTTSGISRSVPGLSYWATTPTTSTMSLVTQPHCLRHPPPSVAWSVCVRQHKQNAVAVRDINRHFFFSKGSNSMKTIATWIM